jgi:hypothetical protein
MLNLLGLLLPPLIDLINRRIKDSDARFWISVGICAVVGTLITLVSSNLFAGLSISGAVEVTAMNIISVFGMAQLSYGGVWKSSEARKKLDLDATIRPSIK